MATLFVGGRQQPVRRIRAEQAAAIGVANGKPAASGGSSAGLRDPLSEKFLQAI